MGLSKTEEFTVKDNKIAQYAKALSHPARVAIIQLLLKTLLPQMHQLPLKFLTLLLLKTLPQQKKKM